MFRSLLLRVAGIGCLALLATLIGCEDEDCQDTCQRIQDLCHDSTVLLAPCSDVCPLPDETLRCVNRAETCVAALACTAVPSESAP